MNETLVSIGVAMVVPAIAVIAIAITEWRDAAAESPNSARIVLVIPKKYQPPIAAKTHWQQLWHRLKGLRSKVLANRR